MFITPKSTSGRPSLASQSFINTNMTGRRSLQTTPRSTPTAKRAANIEQVIEETTDYVVTALNTPVPVQIQEALKSTGGNCGVCLDKNGWAWLVSGHKLWLWRYSSQQVTAQCVSVSLLSTRGGNEWSSETVAVGVQATESNVPLLAISPEGKAQYWSNVLRDSSVLCEEVISLGEANSFSLTAVPHSNLYLLASTVAGLYLIQPTESQLLVREVPLPRGVLSGLSRRVTSLFFGGGTTQSQETQRVVCGEEGTVLVLTDSHLQRWKQQHNKMELVYNVELKPVISDSVCLNQWVESNISANQITVWLIDIQLARDKLVLLFAMVLEGSSNAEYGLALFPLHSHEEPSPDVDNLLRLNYTTLYNPGTADSALLQYSILGSSNALLMHSDHTALLVNMNKSPGSPHLVNFPAPNLILGTGHSPTSLILFTFQQGVISVTPQVGKSQHSQLATPIMRQSLLTTPTQRPSPLVRPAAVMAPEVSKEATEVLKTAFAEYLEGNLAAMEALCDEHFPVSVFSMQLDTPGDLGVVGLSILIMDDQPITSDPGWSEGADTAGGKSLILIYRLEQKLLAHDRYLRFLADSGLLDRLTAVTVRGQSLDTRQLLCEHAEKIQGAISARKLHNHVTDQLVRLAVRGRGPSPLSKTEQLYTQLSLFESLLTALPYLHKELLPGITNPQERVELVLTTSTLLLTVLRDAILYRHNNIHMYQIPDTPQDHTPTTPTHDAIYWTSSSEMRSVIREQVELLFNIGRADASEQEKLNVWSFVVGLADILFDGFKVHINSLQPESSRQTKVQRLFEADRLKILTSLMEVEQYGHATELAERYGDFRVLVQLCEGTGDRGKLAEYMQSYRDQGFSDFLFKWYLDEGKLQELLSFSESFPSELGSFLKPHPHLSWLHALTVKDYHQAHNDLKRLADKEVEIVAKKKTLLSLSKLSLLASTGGKGDTSDLDTALTHISYQQSVPQDTLEDAGLDSEFMPPLSTQQIIELYVGEDHHRADEAQFISALELVDLAYPEEGPEATELRCYVWSQAILRDDWSQLNTDNPLKELQKTFFSALIMEGFTRGLDVLSLLPELPCLLTYSTLVSRGVASDPVFQFMLRAGYEQLQRVQASARAGLDQDTGQAMDNS